MDSFWLVVVTLRNSGRQFEITPEPDNRKTARHIARVNQSMGHGAVVVKRHEWQTADDPD